MTTRSVRAEDFRDWLVLWEGYNSFYKRAVSKEVTETTWQRLLNPEEPVFAIVAELEGKLVGFTAYLFHRHTAMIKDVCYLQDLYTDEAVRGRGIGKSLIQAVYDRAKEKSVLQVYWLTHESNTLARSLYDQLAKHSGFIVYSARM